MSVKVRKIKVDSQTADLLEARATARGISVAALLADVARNEEPLPPALAQMRANGEGAWSPDVVADDARRHAEFERTRLGVPWDEVRVWMESWGAPDPRPTPKSRKL